MEVEFNVGACYVLKATAMSDQLAGATGRLTPENAEKVKAVYNDAKKYLEHVRSVDPDRKKANWAYSLYQVYYSLGDQEKVAEIEKIMNGN